MTSAQLLEFFRGLAADNTPLFLWSDILLLRLASEGQKEACRRSRLLVDSTTPDLCRFDLPADTQSIILDPRIIFIRRVKLDSAEFPLQKIHRKDLDLSAPGWEDAAASVTTHYCTNYQTGKLYLHTRLPKNDSLRLTVIREPLADLALSGPAVDPEIAPRYHEKLVHWMFYRALNMRDVEEKYDPEVAKEELLRFEAEFGPPSRAIDEKWWQDEHGYDEFEGLF